MTALVSANQPYVVKVEYPGIGKKSDLFNNDCHGFPPDAGSMYFEIGDVPITIRYADYGRMFEGVLTVILNQ